MNNPVDINSIPVELLPIIFSNLENKDLLQWESVCSQTHAQIQEIWNRKFEEMNLPISEETASKLDKKSYVLALKGFVKVDFFDHIRPLSRIFHSGLSFNNDPKEPYVSVIVWNDESVDECKKKHHGKCLVSLPLQGTWTDGYSKLPDQKFPSRVPLRFFINKNGDYLKKREPIQLFYKGKKVVLITDYKETRVFEKLLPSLEKGLARSVKICELTQDISEDQIKKAKDSAMNNKEEWIVIKKSD